jgi:ribosomal-protein-alanine N-acetyltransferase
VSVIERLLRRDGTGDLSIEPMRRRDLRHGVYAIEAASHPRPWSRSVFAGEIDQMPSGTRHYLVARCRREIVGYAGLWFGVDEAHVTNVAVRPEWRRSGIATRLMLGLADEVIDRGCPAWTLEVRVSGVGAQGLYRAFGFAPAGVRTRYYENSEDAIVMWCHDVQSSTYRELLDEIAVRVNPCATDGSAS